MHRFARSKPNIAWHAPGKPGLAACWLIPWLKPCHSGFETIEDPKKTSSIFCDHRIAKVCILPSEPFSSRNVITHLARQKDESALFQLKPLVTDIREDAPVCAVKAKHCLACPRQAGPASHSLRLAGLFHGSGLAIPVLKPSAIG